MPPNLPKIEPQSMADRVENALKEAFYSHHLKPGDIIVEREIARQMKVGTPVVREALISLQLQGFVRRVAHTGTFVSEFSKEEVRQLYSLRVELEVLAFQWARPLITGADLTRLRCLVEIMVRAGKSGNRREFLERDYEFHRRCWSLSRNVYLIETLQRLMAPLFVFVVLASTAPLTASMGREHYELIDSFENLGEPEFTSAIRKTLSCIAGRWLSVFGMASRTEINDEI
jgi:DNA-binding GntR family transcriptional regulator